MIQGISLRISEWFPEIASRESIGGSMNWDQVEGKWKQASGKAKEKWGKLTDDDLQRISGKRDQLIGRIQERYGVAKEEAERQVDEFSRTYGTNETVTHAKVRSTSG
jgi:uncharacterized protein YjbJ (UPF0337 family)